jgi:hypothetical protein
VSLVDLRHRRQHDPSDTGVARRLDGVAVLFDSEAGRLEGDRGDHGAVDSGEGLSERRTVHVISLPDFDATVDQLLVDHLGPARDHHDVLGGDPLEQLLCGEPAEKAAAAGDCVLHVFTSKIGFFQLCHNHIYDSQQGG